MREGLKARKDWGVNAAHAELEEAGFVYLDSLGKLYDLLGEVESPSDYTLTPISDRGLIRLARKP